MKGFDKVASYDFNNPSFRTIAMEDAENGDHESMCWLRDNVQEAQKKGDFVDPYLLYFVTKKKKGGTRNNCRVKKRGDRGLSAYGQHNQLRQAVEMFKLVQIDNRSVREAKAVVANSLNCGKASARNAYYQHINDAQFKKNLIVQLAMDCANHPCKWPYLEVMFRELKSGKV